VCQTAELAPSSVSSWEWRICVIAHGRRENSTRLSQKHVLEQHHRTSLHPHASGDYLSNKLGNKSPTILYSTSMHIWRGLTTHTLGLLLLFSLYKPFLRRRWILPTGNCKPARLDRLFAFPFTFPPLPRPDIFQNIRAICHYRTLPNRAKLGSQRLNRQNSRLRGILEYDLTQHDPNPTNHRWRHKLVLKNKTRHHRMWAQAKPAFAALRPKVVCARVYTRSKLGTNEIQSAKTTELYSSLYSSLHRQQLKKQLSFLGRKQWRLQAKNIWGAWPLIIWEATTAKRNLL